MDGVRSNKGLLMVRPKVFSLLSISYLKGNSIWISLDEGGEIETNKRPIIDKNIKY